MKTRNRNLAIVISTTLIGVTAVQFAHYKTGASSIGNIIGQSIIGALIGAAAGSALVASMPQYKTGE